MKQWFAMLAAVAFLSVPAMVTANDEDRIPPEANWSATPPTPSVIAISQPRVVSTAPEQAIEAGAVQRSRAFFSLTEGDAKYQAVNKTTKE